MRAKEFTEASYTGNIGAMEVARFMQTATPRQKTVLRKLIDSDQISKAWQLVQKVTGVKLQGREFSESYQGGLRKWFKQKWVNIGKNKKGGGHPECGTGGEKRGYAKCVPASKAASMTKKEKESAVRRKRAAQRKAGRGGKSQPGQGNKPIRVSTKVSK